jgi:hypothetical protein
MPHFRHLDPLRQCILSLQTRLPPEPWRKAGIHGVGGLLSVGFAEHTDSLLVVSSQGRGVFDCHSGQRLARDHAAPDPDSDWYDEIHLWAIGIGPLAGQKIRLAGLHGGGLPLYTSDWWSLTTIAPEWPDYRVILFPPFTDVYSAVQAGVQVAAESELRACGFSDTGQSFIIATSSDIMIFTRGAADAPARAL